MINNFVIVLVCAKCSKLITLEENIISVQQHPLCLPLFFAFSSEVLNSGIKSCFDRVVFQDAVYEKCFSIRLRSLHLYFCYYFYEGFIHEIVLVSRFLPFTCISYPLKVFKFDTGILRDSYAVPLLKTLTRQRQSIVFLCLFLFLMFPCNNFPFRAFVTMLYSTSTEVLLNLVAPLDSAVPSLDFEQINVFELPVLIPLVLYLILSVSAEVSLNFISHIRFKCSFF